MGIVRTDIIEHSFSAQQTGTGKLSILIGMDSFCYGIFDARQQPVLLRRIFFDQKANFALDLTYLEQNHPYLFFPFAEVSIGLAMPRHVLVPERLFDPEHLRTYLVHGNRMDINDVVRAEVIQGQEARLVYTIPAALSRWLSRHFPKARIEHLCLALLRKLPTNWKLGKHLLVHVWENHLWIFYLQEGKLVFENAFACRDAKDFLYFTLLAYDEFQLQPEDQPVTLSGAILPNSDVYRLLCKYIRHVEFIELGGPFALGRRMAEHPAHFFNDLAAIAGY